MLLMILVFGFRETPTMAKYLEVVKDYAQPGVVGDPVLWLSRNTNNGKTAKHLEVVKNYAQPGHHEACGNFCFIC